MRCLGSSRASDEAAPLPERRYGRSMPPIVRAGDSDSKVTGRAAAGGSVTEGGRNRRSAEILMGAARGRSVLLGWGQAGTGKQRGGQAGQSQGEGAAMQMDQRLHSRVRGTHRGSFPFPVSTVVPPEPGSTHIL